MKFFGNFQKQITQEIEHLLAYAEKDHTLITNEMLESLPEPVERWLKHSGIVGKKTISIISLKQKGLMRLKKDQKKWISSKAVQHFRTEDPSFIWSVKMKMMGVPILGRDLFIDGQGEMLIKAGGVFPVAKAGSTTKINQSTLQRYLGEIVWFPSAALKPYITWEPLDENSARATMTIGETTGSAIFYFTPDGDLEKFVAWRYKNEDDDNPTQWMATINKTEKLNGIRIPVNLEAAWIEKGEVFTWYKFEVYDVIYN